MRSTKFSAPPTPMDKAIDHDTDHWARDDQARHNRRMRLLRMQGECNRQEARVAWLWAIAITLGILALALGAIAI